MSPIQCLHEVQGRQKKSLAHNQSNKIRSKYSHSSYKRMARCLASRNDWARGADTELPGALKHLLAFSVLAPLKYEV